VIIGFKIQNTIGKLSSQNIAVAPGNLNSGRIVVVRIELEVKGLVVLVTYVMRGDDNIARSLCSSSMPPLVFVYWLACQERTGYLLRCLNAFSTDFVRLAYQSSKSS
jgi:hypothetical protein